MPSTLRLLAHGYTPRPDKEGDAWNREQMLKIDRHWHDLRHEGASRLLADGVDIRIIQLMLGHASVQQTHRYFERDRRGTTATVEVSLKRGKALRLIAGQENPLTECHTAVTPTSKMWRARQGSNLRPSAPEADALSS